MNRTILLILLFLLFLFFWIFGASKLSDWFCPGGDSDKISAAGAVGTGDAYCGPWSISTNDEALSVESDRYLRFAKGESEIVPYADELNDLLSATASYLADYPDQTLTIVGFYSDDESNPSDYADLGLARAEAVKDRLLDLNTTDLSINVESDYVEEGRGFHSDTLCHGVEFRFDDEIGDAGNDEERIGAIGDRLHAEPVRLYFETDAKEPNLTDQNKRDLQDIVFYLEQVPDSRVEVSGHTDNGGSGNERLSRKRAERTAAFLAANWGIGEDRMDAKGYADAMPIADNGSSDGRAQNRRVEVKLMN